MWYCPSLTNMMFLTCPWSINGQAEQEGKAEYEMEAIELLGFSM